MIMQRGKVEIVNSRSERRLRCLVQRFRHRCVAVVGDVMLDRFVRGRVTRLSPEAPVPVVEVDSLEGTPHPGGAANVIVNLHALGARAIPFGVIGRDEAGRTLQEELRRLHVPVAGLIADPHRHTTVKIRISSGPHHIARVDWEQREPLSASVERRLLKRFERVLGRVDAVVVSDYDKGTLTGKVLKVVLSSCRARNIPVFVDLKRWPRHGRGRRPRELKVMLVLINEGRAADISNRDIHDQETARVAGWQLREAFGCQHLVITRGSKGMMIFNHRQRSGSREPIHAVEHRPWEVFDVTGAGDTVVATLTLGFLAGASADEAAEIANHAAGVVVSKPGTAACPPEELLDSLNQHRRG